MSSETPRPAWAQSIAELICQKWMLPAFGTWQVVLLDLDGRKWMLHYTIMSWWNMARLLCACVSGIIMKNPSVCWLSASHTGNHGRRWRAQTRKHSFPAPGFWCRHRSGEQECLPVHPNSEELWPSSRQSVLPRWRRAFASTHSLTVPGFWLGFSHRQEHRLTMPATSQNTQNRIIDRIHFQLPSWAG